MTTHHERTESPLVTKAKLFLAHVDYLHSVLGVPMTDQAERQRIKTFVVKAIREGALPISELPIQSRLPYIREDHIDAE